MMLGPFMGGPMPEVVRSMGDMDGGVGKREEEWNAEADQGRDGGLVRLWLQGM